MSHFRLSSSLNDSSYYIGIDPQLSGRDTETFKVCAAKIGAALEKEAGALTANGDAGADRGASP